MRVIPKTVIQMGEWSWACALADDNNFVLVAGVNKVAIAKIVFDKKTGKPESMKVIAKTIVKVGGWTWCADISSDGRFVVFGTDDDETLRLAEILRDSKNGEILGMEVRAENEIKVGFPTYSCEISSDNSFVVYGTGGADKKLRLASISENIKNKKLEFKEIPDSGFFTGGEVYACLIEQEQDLVIFGSSDYKMHGAQILRDAKTSKVIKLESLPALDIELDGQPYCMDFSRKNKLMLVGTESERIEVYDILEDTSRNITGFKKRPDLDIKLDVPPSICDVSKDEEIVLIGSADGRVWLVKPICNLKTKRIKGFKIIPDSKIELGVRIVDGHISSDKNFAVITTANDAITRIVDLTLTAPKEKKTTGPKYGVQTLESGVEQIIKAPSLLEYRKQQEMFLALEEVSQMLVVEADLNGVLTEIATKVGKAIGAKWVNFWDITPDKKGTYITAAYGMDQAFIDKTRSSPIPLGSAFIGRAIATGKPWGASNCQTSPKTFSPLMKGVVRLNVYGLLCIPTISQGEVLGGMCIYYQHPHPFSQFELRLTTIAANQAATAVKNIRTFNELKSEQQKNLSIIQSLNDGLIMYDLEDNVVFFNPKASQYIWLETKDVVGEKIDENFANKSVYHKNVYEIRKIAQKDYESKEYTTSGNQKLVLEVSLVPVRGPGGEKVGEMQVLRDITKSKEVEIMKSNFVSVASHQLRTPLTVIKWTLGSLLAQENDGKLSQKQEGLVKDAVGVNQHMISLVSDLLDAARIEEGRFGYEFAPKDVFALVEKIVDELRPVAEEKEVHLTNVRPEKPLPNVSIDEKKLNLSIRNVVENAIKYTPKGGKVDVGFKEGKNSIFLIVKDNGIGIPKDEQKFIFNKFFRAANAVKFQTTGSGLGLYIAKSIADKHNATLSFEAKEGEGSDFMFQFPTSERDMPKGILGKDSK